MKTVAMILELTAPLQAGFHIRIENEPWMTLVIEDTQERGPNGLPGNLRCSLQRAERRSNACSRYGV